MLVIRQSPALDVMGFGLDNGQIVIHDIKHDETIMTFKQDWGPVVSLDFRTGMHVCLTRLSGSRHGLVT